MHILDKIKKLFALSTSNNPNEAASAAAKAQALLAQYNLELSKVEGDASQHSDYYQQGQEPNRLKAMGLHV